MKLLYPVLFCFSFLIFCSCSIEDPNNPKFTEDNLFSPEELPKGDPSNKENQQLDPELVSDNLKIEYATTKQGNMPSPKGDIELSLEEPTTTAYQLLGFTLFIDSEKYYAGAYIQMKDDQGNLAPNHWDVNFDTEFKRASMAKSAKNSSKSGRYFFNVIEINFKENQGAGRFCFDLAVYDIEGNISPARTFCVKIESWGGLDGILGKWSLEKKINNEITQFANSKSCSNFTVECINGDSIFVGDAICQTIEEESILLNSDGTYEYKEQLLGNEVDREKTETSCAASFKPQINITFLSKGYWSYLEESQQITLVEFENVENHSLNGQYEASSQNGYLFKSKVDLELDQKYLYLRNNEWESPEDEKQSIEELFFTR